MGGGGEVLKPVKHVRREHHTRIDQTSTVNNDNNWRNCKKETELKQQKRERTNG
jgi:hypothetical protein